MEKITKIDSTKISVTKDATEYSKEFVDNQVEILNKEVLICEATEIEVHKNTLNKRAERDYMIKLQTQFT